MTKYKYPRTVHHPLSQSITDDDKVLKDDSNFINKNKELFNNLNKEKDEGLVIRITDSFTYDEFKNSVCKLVRANHVQPDEEHWMHKQIIPNKLII